MIIQNQTNNISNFACLNSELNECERAIVHCDYCLLECFFQPGLAEFDSKSVTALLGNQLKRVIQHVGRERWEIIKSDPALVRKLLQVPADALIVLTNEGDDHDAASL